MKHYNVIIIGGGASGCMCALTTKNKSVAIIDCGKTIAKKIMVTGNGRCNLTNMEASSKFYNANIDKYLNKFKHLYIFLTLDNEKINRFTHSKLDKLKLFII